MSSKVSDDERLVLRGSKYLGGTVFHYPWHLFRVDELIGTANLLRGDNGCGQ